MRSYDQAIEEIYKEVEVRTARAAAKRKRAVKLASICTPFCVVLIIAAVLTLGGPMNITEPPVDGTSGVTPLPNGKLPISSIPGATVVDHANAVVASDGLSAMPETTENFVGAMKSRKNIVIGEARNINSITVKSGEYYIWCITTFEIVVCDSIRFDDDSAVLNCVTAKKCFLDGSDTVSCGVSNVAKDILDNPQGMFLIRDEITDNTRWSFDGNDYEVGDYADYFISGKYNVTDDSFFYFGDEVKFDVIRGNIPDAKKDISTIPNTTVVTDANAFIDRNVWETYKWETWDRYLQKESLIKILTTDQGDTSVIGRAENFKTVKRENGENTWYITTFDIMVTEAVNPKSEADVKKCVAVMKYENGRPNVGSRWMNNVNAEITDGKERLFVLYPVQYDLFKMDDYKLHLFEVADYYVCADYIFENDSFSFHGETINMNEIRKMNEIS